MQPLDQDTVQPDVPDLFNEACRTWASDVYEVYIAGETATVYCLLVPYTTKLNMLFVGIICMGGVLPDPDTVGHTGLSRVFRYKTSLLYLKVVPVVDQ